MTKNVPAVKIRLRGLAGTGYDNQQTLAELSGYRLVKDGQDYVVYDDDPKLSEARPSFLNIGEPIDLQSHDAPTKIAAAVVGNGIPPDMDAPNSFGVIGDLGFLSRLDKAARPFFMARDSQLADAFQKHVSPVVAEMGATIARPATVDMKRFYSRVVLPKLSFLITTFGMAAAEEAILNRRLFTDVLPTPLDPYELFDALLLFPPYLAAFPLHRPSCEVVFIPPRIQRFDFRLFQTLPQYLGPEPTHLQARGKSASLGQKGFDGEAEEFVLLAAECANAFWDFFTRPQLWLNKEGELDNLHQIKAISLGRLLVRDVLAIQQTSTSFAKVRLMFEFFDKFAALCVERHGIVSDREKAKLEASWASRITQDDMLALPARIFRYHHRVQRKGIFLVLAQFAENIRASVLRDFRAMHKEAGVERTPESTAECIRLIRNLAHGTFLSYGKFEKLLLKINPVVPPDAVRLPWLYLLAFSLDPEFFMKEAIAVFTK